MNALRQTMGWFFNLLVPGSGLIIRRREWLGISVAAVFGICANAALAGWLIAPAAMPRGLTILAGILTVLTWLAAQVLFWRRTLAENRRLGDVSIVLREARMAMEASEIGAARIPLEGDLALDDEEDEIGGARTRTRAVPGEDPGGRSKD